MSGGASWRPCKFFQTVQMLHMLQLIDPASEHNYNLRTPNLQRAPTAGRPARRMPRLYSLHYGYRQRIHRVHCLQALIAQQRQARHTKEGVVHIRHILRAVRDAAAVLVLHLRALAAQQRKVVNGKWMDSL